MTDLYRLSASDLARALQARDVSAIEVTEAHLDRLDAVNPTLNAVVQDNRDEAMDTARKLDAQRAKGEPLGPLAGIPVTTKVNVDQAGFATTNGLRLQADAIAAEDNPVVANMRKAGGVILGRTNTPAFSMRWFTKNDLHGQTLNPRNLDLTPGGSSGGASSAVAAGICALAHGTDIAGSVRYPAYACGLHGLRPTFGRVPAYNASAPDRFIGAQLMAVSGPLARSMDDIALALEAMSVTDTRDPWYIPMSSEPRPFARRMAFSIAPDDMPVVPEVKETLIRAARILEDAGWEVEETTCPPIREAAHLNALLWMAETELAAKALIEKESERDSQFVFDMMTRDIGPITLETVMRALQRRATLVREWEVFFQDYPLLLCPVSGELPFAQQSDVASEADFTRIYEAQLTQRGLPLMGMPALSVAMGAINAAPVGVQLVSGKFREDILLSAGREIETAVGAPEVANLA